MAPDSDVRASFRFYAELNDFLPPGRKQTTFEHTVAPRTAVKDAIESLGVPHTEIDLILANGESVAFSYHIRPHDRISVYPMFEAIDVGPLTRVRAQPLRHVHFVLDAHLGRLARYLRLAGFDTVYQRDARDDGLARLAARERRILLTRDQGLLKRRMVSHGLWMRATDPRRQFVEVLRRLDLTSRVQPFTRCLRCNAPLVEIARETVRDRISRRVRALRTEFRACRGCGRVYWQGSHHDAMVRFLEASLDAARQPDVAR